MSSLRGFIVGGLAFVLLLSFPLATRAAESPEEASTRKCALGYSCRLIPTREARAVQLDASPDEVLPAPTPSSPAEQPSVEKPRDAMMNQR